jgi:outer membrane receptor protein involved in Fe transport
MKKSIFILFIFGIFSAQAQNLWFGKIINKASLEPISGAVIRFGENEYALSDAQGRFKIKSSDTLLTLYFSHLGFVSDSLVVSHQQKGISMQMSPAPVELKGANIGRKRKSTEISTLDSRAVQTITTRELQKAACCNLSESFETSAAVDVSLSDALTGARRIKMLGLDGKYVQLLTENTSEFRGLGQAYGIQYVPGHWMESIQILKGAGSVAQGYEAFTGQMNVELLKPREAEKFSMSAYQSSQGRSELTAHVAGKVNTAWHGLLAAHTQQEHIRWDMNHDGFLDQPLINNVNVYNRWHWQGKRAESQIGIKYLRESRNGGEVPLPEGIIPLVPQYFINHHTERLYAWAKFGILFPGKPYKSIGNILSSGIHNQHSQLGWNDYQGKEKNLQYSFLYQTIWKDTRHQIKMGASYLWDQFDEKFRDSSWNRTEHVPGIFVEWHEKPQNLPLDLIVGLRADRHNLYGGFLTPRFNLKWNLTDNNIIKISYGTGFRTVNALVENIGFFASGRQWIVEEAPQAERSQILGGSFIKMMDWFGREWVLTLDYYETHFQNQWLVDVEESGTLRMYNQKAPSFSKSFQAELNGEVLDGTTLRLAYKYDDPRSGFSGGTKIRPLVEQHRFLANTGWESYNGKWLADATVTYTGRKRLPSYYALPQTVLGYSPGFFLVNGQVTKKFKFADWYVGVENALNFRQHHPIVGAPIGPGFDAAMVWGPIMGRNVYLGMRYKIK